jgi:uncharacterized protein
MASRTVPQTSAPTLGRYAVFLLLGMYFGVVLMKAEVVSWYRIQEMFRFQSFHMYGVIGSAVLVGMLSLWLIRRLGLKDAGGQPLVLPPKESARYRYLMGGALFGFGWALTGACPGPIYALLGGGYSVMLAVLLSAVAGTYVYGLVRDRLPH